MLFWKEVKHDDLTGYTKSERQSPDPCAGGDNACATGMIVPTVNRTFHNKRGENIARKGLAAVRMTRKHQIRA